MEKPLNINKGHHPDRKDLPGEHRWGDAGQLILLIIFMIIWILDSFVYNLTTYPADHIPHWIRIGAGGLSLIIAFLLAMTGLRIVFGEIREIPAVIEKSVFGMMRHPIYLGAILLFTGLFLLTLSLASGAVLLIILIFYHLIARYEERILIHTFGDAYRAYMSRVPMWLPKIRRRKPCHQKPK